MGQKRVAITGSAFLCGSGDDPSQVFDLLVSSFSALGFDERFPDAGSRFNPVEGRRASVSDAAKLGVPRRDFRILGADAAWLMQCAIGAWDASGLGLSRPQPEDIGLFAGMGMADYKPEDLVGAALGSAGEGGGFSPAKFYAAGYKEIHPLWPLSMLNNVGFCLTAIRLEIRGENAVFSPWADSGLHALHAGFSSVRSGRSTAALAGGVSEAVTPQSAARARLAGVCDMSDRPAPLGEGGGVCVLEEWQNARARGVTPLAVVGGFGMAGATGGALDASSWDGIFTRAIRDALDEAGAADEAEVVAFCHFPPSSVGGRGERAALRRLEHPSGGWRAGCSKLMLGHLLAGSPAVDAALAAGWLARAGGPRVALVHAASETGYCAAMVLARA